MYTKQHREILARLNTYDVGPTHDGLQVLHEQKFESSLVIEKELGHGPASGVVGYLDAGWYASEGGADRAHRRFREFAQRIRLKLYLLLRGVL